MRTAFVVAFIFSFFSCSPNADLPLIEREIEKATFIDSARTLYQLVGVDKYPSLKLGLDYSTNKIVQLRRDRLLPVVDTVLYAPRSGKGPGEQLRITDFLVFEPFLITIDTKLFKISVYDFLTKKQVAEQLLERIPQQIVPLDSSKFLVSFFASENIFSLFELHRGGRISEIRSISYTDIFEKNPADSPFLYSFLTIKLDSGFALIRNHFPEAIVLDSAFKVIRTYPLARSTGLLLLKKEGGRVQGGSRTFSASAFDLLNSTALVLDSLIVFAANEVELEKVRFLDLYTHNFTFLRSISMPEFTRLLYEAKGQLVVEWPKTGMTFSLVP